MTDNATSVDLNKEAQETQNYDWYNLLVWLRRAAPGSDVTQKEFGEAQAANPEYGEREHPDLSHWSSGVFSLQPISPVNKETLLQKPAGDQLEWLLVYQGEGARFEGPSRHGLMLALRDAVKESFNWSWDLANALVKHTGSDQELWSAIVDAWGSSSLTAENWGRVLTLVKETPGIEEAADRAVAVLLEHALDDDSAAPDTVFPSVIEIAERLIKHKKLKDGLVQQPPIDWLLLAINHAAGKAMLAWLRVLGRLREKVDDKWTGLAPVEQQRIDRVLDRKGTSSDRARTIIASQVHFLFGLDPDWCLTKVLPLFDWTIDKTRAAQAWSGYLQWGRWNNALFAAMRPYLEQTYKRIGSELPDLVDALATRLAGVALYGSEDPWHGWLEKFIADADPPTRVAWVRQVGHELRQLKPEAIVLAWRRWIFDSWKDRLTGVPRPLTKEEREAISEWVPRLDGVMSEAVALIEQMDVPLAEHTSIFYELVERGLASREPVASARFTRHLLKGAKQLLWECEHLDKLVRTFIASRVERNLLLDLCDSMGRLGCPTASALRELVPAAG